MNCFIAGKMLGLKNESSITLSGEQIESMDACDLESVIEEVQSMPIAVLSNLPSHLVNNVTRRSISIITVKIFFSDLHDFYSSLWHS